ncbi:uncharacterized protein BCR38DRAFT_424346 [Pseudomassariella vexata]|uniref:Uncharacterized protein n=1 Tax=Pseudomassariella vexata TaxID=1141098 RepID=A0A1Y2EB39_9PEZI|nr:uncharacterized protein BCR38DRAFT_424346 [Pseudomassariella vexata]ORY68793.1 hypothetical protein BCR38DRAFT_424346 [Pseudomassariella vexata]
MGWCKLGCERTLYFFQSCQALSIDIFTNSPVGYTRPETTRRETLVADRGSGRRAAGLAIGGHLQGDISWHFGTRRSHDTLRYDLIVVMIALPPGDTVRKHVLIHMCLFILIKPSQDTFLQLYLWSLGTKLSRLVPTIMSLKSMARPRTGHTWLSLDHSYILLEVPYLLYGQD